MRCYLIIFFFLHLLEAPLNAQQIADTSLVPMTDSPNYPTGSGPLVLVDQAHHNFHTLDGRFAPFGQLLQQDGYRLNSLSDSITGHALDPCRILVISNAIHPSNEEHWALPAVSAFSPGEIKVLVQWVAGGGRLLLIADHMPFPGAVSELAQAFGFTLNNGFAQQAERTWPPSQFDRKSKTLLDHSITAGAQATAQIDSVATFTGSAFQIPAEATSLLVFPQGYETLIPDTAWKFHSLTKRLPIEGWSQGAVRHYGRGRVAVFGEAAMFTAQIAGAQKTKVGFNSPQAPQNAQFVLNVIHWLDED